MSTVQELVDQLSKLLEELNTENEELDNPNKLFAEDARKAFDPEYQQLLAEEKAIEDGKYQEYLALEQSKQNHPSSQRPKSGTFTIDRKGYAGIEWEIIDSLPDVVPTHLMRHRSDPDFEAKRAESVRNRHAAQEMIKQMKGFGYDVDESILKKTYRKHGETTAQGDGLRRPWTAFWRFIVDEHEGEWVKFLCPGTSTPAGARNFYSAEGLDFQCYRRIDADGVGWGYVFVEKAKTRFVRLIEPKAGGHDPWQSIYPPITEPGVGFVEIPHPDARRWHEVDEHNRYSHTF